MNIFEFKNTKAGMTLIEMVISLAILSVLMTSSMGMIISSNSIFISTSKAALDKQVGNSVFELLQSVIKYSTHLQIGDTVDSSASQHLSLSVKDSTTESGYILYYNRDYDKNDTGTATNLYDTSFYGALRSVKYKVESVGGTGKHVRITVIVCRDGEEVYTTSSIVKCVNLSLTSGSTNNAITVSEDAPEYNPVLSFTCDEMLLSGGESAWSVEYKVNEYLAKYNTILNDYYKHLSAANAEVDSTYNTYKSKTGNDVITKPTLLRILNDRSDSVFGTEYDVVEDALNFDDILAKPTDSIVENATWNKQVVWSDTLTECATWKNIRAYYQKEIYDLLGYSPKTITDTTNPYYMVIASKEELYTGFLLTYYDKDGDGKVTQTEYPNFGSTSSEIKDFFGGTTLEQYADGSVEGDSMVILAYCIDNVNDDDYQNSFYSTTKVDLECKYDVEEDRLKNDAEGGPTKWVSSSGSRTYYPSPILTSDNIKYENNSIESSINFSSLGYNTLNQMTYVINATDDEVYDWDYWTSWGTGYHRWEYLTYTYSLANHVISISSADDEFRHTTSTAWTWGHINKNCFLSQEDVDKYYSFKSAGTYLINNLGGAVEGFNGARNIETYATNEGSEYYGYSHSDYLNGIGQYTEFKAKEDLPEGWYYYKFNAETIPAVDTTTGYGNLQSKTESGTVYVFFYLKADYGEKSKIDGSGTMSYNKNKIAVSKDRIIHIFLKNSYEMDFISYEQAQYVGANDEYAKVNLEFYTWDIKKAHQYTDWMLYGVDWNSWFSQKTGLLNQGMTAVVTWISKFTGGEVGTITSVSASNSDLSLGRVGSYSVSGVSTKSRSYNTAWMVYNASKGTWYYLPAVSTATSSIWSGVSFTSAKDTPTVLDLENDIENSAKLEYYINNRKYYSKVLETFKTNGKADVTWVPLPTSTEQVNATS